MSDNRDHSSREPESQPAGSAAMGQEAEAAIDPTAGHFEHEVEAGAHGEASHAIHIEAAEPDRASYPWLMTVIAAFLSIFLVGVTLLWLYFQRQSEGTVQTQVLTVPNEALVQLRAREREELTTYGVVNREQGLYRVPVDRGIDLYLETFRTRAAAGEPIRIGAPAPAAGTVPSPAPAPAPAGGS